MGIATAVAAEHRLEGNSEIPDESTTESQTLRCELVVTGIDSKAPKCAFEAAELEG
jgi:hypothetical protein